MPICDFRCHVCGELFEFLVPSLLRGRANTSGTTCCGQEERCEAPPCSTGEQWRRHQYQQEYAVYGFV